MAKSSKDESKGIDVKDRVAALEVSDTASWTALKKIKAWLEEKAGMDLDGDGKIGSVRLYALLCLLVVTLVGSFAMKAHAADLFVLYDNDAVWGTFKVTSDLAGTATLQVDAISATLYSTLNVAGAVTTAGSIIRTPGTIAHAAGVFTQTVADATYILAPTATCTQRLAAATSGQNVLFVNTGAFSVYLDVDWGDTTVGSNDACRASYIGTEWFVTGVKDN